MIIVRLDGGLGNQMFQYAFARSINLRTGKSVRIDPVKYQKKRDSQITTLSTQNHAHNINKEANPGFVLKLKRILAKIKRRLYSLDNPGQYKVEIKRTYKLYHLNIKLSNLNILNLLWLQFIKLTSKVLHIWKVDKEIEGVESYTFHERFYNPKDFSYLIGYWQTHKYFDEVRNNLLEEMRVITPANEYNQNLLEQIKDKEAVFAHIRRADYVNDKGVNAFLGALNSDYYDHAFKIMTDKVKKPFFVFFSDDIPWVKENIKVPGECIYSENDGFHDYEDIRLMYNCKHAIIANSSFSWWGAWLIKNPAKIVIAPNRWIAQEGIDTSGVVPEEWIKL